MKWHTTVFSGIVTASLVIVTGCSQSGPNEGDIKKSLQSSIPVYWEVDSLKLESSENLGTKTDPNVQARFKAVLKLKEDTFNPVDQASSNQPAKTTNVTLITPSEGKGKTVELYGLAYSKRQADSWKTEFRFENDPTPSLGVPRSFFKGKTVLKNSSEEEALKAEISRQAEAERKAVLAKLLSGEREGQFYDARGYYSYPFKIRFTSVSPESQNIAGTLTFSGGVIKSFEGTLSSTELKFTTNKVIQGNDAFGTGTTYALFIGELNSQTQQVAGTWKHTDNKTGEVKIQINQQ